MLNEKKFTPFYFSFLRLCNSMGKSPSTVAKEAGISSGAPTAWKRGAIPKPAQREKLCAYFSVSDATLLGYEGTKNPPGPEAEGLRKRTDYEKLNDENRKIVDDLIASLLKSQSGGQQ